MERDVDALERDGGEATLELDGGRLGFGLLGAFVNDFDELGLDVFEGESLHESLNVDLLRFEVVGDVCQAVQST